MTPPDARLQRDFDEAMLQVYVRARDECRYNATRFLQMLHERRGIETARRLLPSMSDGYAELWRRGRLDLTVEALILRKPWRRLFTGEELRAARRRLEESNYNFANGENSAGSLDRVPLLGGQYTELLVNCDVEVSGYYPRILAPSGLRFSGKCRSHDRARRRSGIAFQLAHCFGQGILRLARHGSSVLGVYRVIRSQTQARSLRISAAAQATAVPPHTRG